jgi:hypothetical protein
MRFCSSRTLSGQSSGLRIADRLERAVIRLGLASQGEFVSIINAIQMQLESGSPAVPVIARLTEALRELARARGVDLLALGSVTTLINSCNIYGLELLRPGKQRRIPTAMPTQDGANTLLPNVLEGGFDQRGTIHVPASQS